MKSWSSATRTETTVFLLNLRSGQQADAPPAPREAEECDLFHLVRSLVLLHKGWTQHTDLAVLFLEETKCGLNCE